MDEAKALVVKYAMAPERRLKKRSRIYSSRSFFATFTSVRRADLPHYLS